MKNPFKKKQTPTNKPSTPPAVVKLTAADLERVQGGTGGLKGLSGIKGESRDDRHKDEIDIR